MFSGIVTLNALDNILRHANIQHAIGIFENIHKPLHDSRNNCARPAGRDKSLKAG